MIATASRKSCSGRVHYAWVVLGVMFLSTLCGMGVRSAPGVMIVPLEHAFGWSVGTISGAVSLNILLLGLLGPFMAGLMEGFGLKRTLLLCLALMLAGTSLSVFMTEPWQLFATWGLMVGIGSSAGAIGMATAVVNRWFVTRRGLAIGIMISANAAGQLIFLPLLAGLSERFGWQSVGIAVSLSVAALIPLLILLLPESPGRVGLLALGATAPPPGAAGQHNPVTVAMRGLERGARSLDFWLLVGSFSICGFSANGLVGTHLIAYCVDQRHRRGAGRRHGGLAGAVQPDRLHRGGLDDRPVQSARAAVLDLQPARPVAAGAAVYRSSTR